MTQKAPAAEICDPLYGHIYFDRSELAVISHPAFQRLRFIQQLGFCQHAFPSGTGSRLAHSLGAAHLAGIAFDSIFSKPAARSLSLSAAKKKEFRKALRFAALLHDTGHAPLSHPGESLMPPLSALNISRFLKAGPDRQARHEDFSAQLIMESGLSEIIRRAGLEPLSVAQLIHHDMRSDGGDFFRAGGASCLPLLRQIISSELDVDRMDYLNRDSLFCGVKYGLNDFMWLVSHFDLHIEGDQALLAAGEGALYAIESFLLGRRHMRLIVYFHHKTAIYTRMLKKYAESCGWTLPSDTESYLLFDESLLFQKLRESERGSPWARRIIRQEPYIRLCERSESVLSPGAWLSGQSGTQSGCLELSSAGGASSKHSGGDLFEELEAELSRASIPLIKIDSKKHVIKPPGELPGSYPVFLKAQDSPPRRLFGGGDPISLPPKRVERLYAAPEGFRRAKEILSRLQRV